MKLNNCVSGSTTVTTLFSLVVRAYLPKAISRIFEVSTAYTIKNMTILRKRSSVIPFLCGIPRNFTVFTAIK